MIMKTNKLNSTAKLAFYNARKRDGDVKRLAETTGYSVSHITNIMNGTHNINNEVANTMYKISARRQKVSEMA